MIAKVHETAGTAIAEKGVVMLDGPDGTALSLTPAAARLMGESLIRAAAIAKEQAWAGFSPAHRYSSPLQ